ncbi:MAG TPA: hypothetical protein VFB14_28895 [Bryobacteraceae bacterium]|jgi:hypothetical protein|nr:hypothetical protein [Bryobacteraceae bacterium]
MSSTIDDYREAKNNYLNLRNQAKKELIARFNELASELLQLQRELREDFGERISLPTKKAKRAKSKQGVVRKARPAATKKVQQAPAAAPSQKVVGIQKRVEVQKKKLAEAQAAGKPTKAIEDRIYELEDELRLANER